MTFKPTWIKWVEIFYQSEETLRQFKDADNFGSLIRPIETDVRALGRCWKQGCGRECFWLVHNFEFCGWWSFETTIPCGSRNPLWVGRE